MAAEKAGRSTIVPCGLGLERLPVMPVPATVLRRRLAYGKTLLNGMSFWSTLSPATWMNSGGLRRSLSKAVMAMSTTSSPKRRPFGQPPGMNPRCQTDPESGSLQHIPAKNAQPRKTSIVRVGGMVWPATRKPYTRGRQVDFDQVGDEDPGNIGARFRCTGRES